MDRLRCDHGKGEIQSLARAGRQCRRRKAGALHRIGLFFRGGQANSRWIIRSVEAMNFSAPRRIRPKAPPTQPTKPRGNISMLM